MVSPELVAWSKRTWGYYRSAFIEAVTWSLKWALKEGIVLGVAVIIFAALYTYFTTEGEAARDQVITGTRNALIGFVLVLGFVWLLHMLARPVRLKHEYNQDVERRTQDRTQLQSEVERLQGGVAEVKARYAGELARHERERDHLGLLKDQLEMLGFSLQRLERLRPRDDSEEWQQDFAGRSEELASVLARLRVTANLLDEDIMERFGTERIVEYLAPDKGDGDDEPQGQTGEP